MSEPLSKQPELTNDDVEHIVQSANGVVAAAGHVIHDPESDDDLRHAIRGDISFDDAVARAIANAKRASSGADRPTTKNGPG